VTIRRVVLSLLLVAGFGMFWLAGHNGLSGKVPPLATDSAVEELIPGDGSPNVLRQSEIGIDLTDGWVASLAVNGRDIPDDQLQPGMTRERAADYVARMLLSFTSAPGRWDLTDRAQVRELVQTELLAGVLVSQ